MSARDDFGSMAGRSGGYNDRAGGIGNGGIGGGMHSGSMGGGAGRNGGAGSRTGLTTNSTWHGNTAWGRPGGSVQGYGTRDRNGNIGNRRNPDGSPIIKSAISQAAPGAMAPTGAPPPVIPAAAPAPPVAQTPVGMPPKPPERSLGWLPGWPGTGQWWGNQAPYQNNSGLSRGQSGAIYDGVYKDNYGEGVPTGINYQSGPGYNGPGSTYTQNGNTVGQNGLGGFRSGQPGRGGR